MTTINLFAAAIFIIFGVWVAHRLLSRGKKRRGEFDADRVRRRR